MAVEVQRLEEGGTSKLVFTTNVGSHVVAGDKHPCAWKPTRKPANRHRICWYGKTWKRLSAVLRFISWWIGRLRKRESCLWKAMVGVLSWALWESEQLTVNS